MPLVVGVDSSTSACKVEVRDADTGELVGVGRAPHPATTPPRSEQHPRDWWAAFQSACEQADVFGRNNPAAIAIAGQQHGLVTLDGRGDVLRPAKLWNDTESARDATELVEQLGPEAWASACGSVPVASFTITKLRWLRRNEPDVFARVARVLLPHDWLTAQLTGEATTDRGDASGTGWWSPVDEAYRFGLLELVDDRVPWSDVVPRVLGPVDAAGEWHRGVVAPGTGDNMAAALGLGLRSGDVVLSLGTSGTGCCVSERPTTDATGRVAGFADATGRYLPLVCTLNATKVTDAVGRLLGLEPTALAALAMTAPPGSRGTVLVPHFDGERTPNRPDATGVLSGLRSDARREEVARAAFEGVVCNLLEAAGDLPVDDQRGRVFLVGGGARSEAYQRIVADLLGRQVIVPAADELVAVGAAVQAAAVLTGAPFDEVAAAWEVARGTTIDPDPAVDPVEIRAAYARAAAT